MSFLASSRRNQNRSPRNNARRASALFEAIERRQLLSASVSWTQVPISSAAVSADPALSNYNSYDLRVTISSGDDWAGAEMRATLSSGNFYTPSSNNSNVEQQSIWSFKPNLQFDTFVSAPNFTSPVVLGVSKFYPSTPIPSSAIFNSNTIDVAWGDLAGTGAGTFTIARLTISKGASGSVTGRVTHLANTSESINFSNGLPPGSSGGGNTASIAGQIYDDVDGDRIKDSTETGINGRTLYLDVNNNSIKDSGEVSTTSDSSGNYKFSSLAAGTYKVREILPSGWQQTTPTSNFGIGVTLTSGQAATGKNFGARPTPAGTASISGNVFHDFNRNRIKESGDSGIGGWKLYIDLNNNSIMDSNEQRLLTDSSGNYKFINLAAGTYKVREVLQSGYVQTTPTSNFGQTVTVSSGQSATGKNFGVDN